jgi:hypothetical protein
MKNQSQNCSLKKHSEINANYFCQECKIFMCNKCDSLHSELLPNHNKNKIDINIDMKDIFTGYCKEEKHNNELVFFCKTHNQLCCAACLSKIRKKGNGQHSQCYVCEIEDIKNEKQITLKDNIKTLEDLSITLNDSINQLKAIFDRVNEDKEKLKTYIQQVFTKIRNIFNEKENKLLDEVDEQYDKLFFKEDIIKEFEKLPKKVKNSLEKGKSMVNKQYECNKLNLFINDCINIENNISNIILMNEKLAKYQKLDNLKIEFSSEEEIKNFCEKISSFGIIKKSDKASKQINLFDNMDLNDFEEKNVLAESINIFDMVKPKNIVDNIFDD